MALSEDEKYENDMTRTGKYCPTCDKELEKVSEEDRYTCHWCGGVFIIALDGTLEETWFEGFE
jgi:transposase-like protein